MWLAGLIPEKATQGRVQCKRAWLGIVPCPGPFIVAGVAGGTRCAVVNRHDHGG